MPHHESGLLALRTTDPKVITRAAKHFLDRAAHPAVELVRADAGKGVWLCFGSFVGADVSAFLDAKGHAKLAKALGQPIWVGHAIGGYSNFQTAMAFSATGKRLWRSEFDFSFPDEMRKEADDPFSAPERRFELIKELRASSGYGRIATEFGLDYFRVLSVDAGDALFAKQKRVLGSQSDKELAKWLTGKFVPPEGEPGDGAEPPAPCQHLAFRFLCAADVAFVSGAIAHLLAVRGVPKGQVSLSVASKKGETVFRLEGKGVKALSTTFVSERFVEFLSLAGEGSLLAFGWNDRQPPMVRAGQGHGAGILEFMRAQREPLVLERTFKPVVLTVSKVLAKKFDKVRAAMAADPGE